MTWRDRLLPVVHLACRWLVGAVLVYASIDKLVHPDAFAQSIANYRMVPMPLLHGFAWLLPVVEAVVGAALIVGWQRRGAALLAAMMMVMFIIAIAWALARGLDISCGCFDTEGGHGVGRDLLVRDVVLLVVALVPLLGQGDRWALDTHLARRAGRIHRH
jgi:uncharacterized membrane protein YphA (DoxX/SURF4 family)